MVMVESHRSRGPLNKYFDYRLDRLHHFYGLFFNKVQNVQKVAWMAWIQERTHRQQNRCRIFQIINQNKVQLILSRSEHNPKNHKPWYFNWNCSLILASNSFWNVFKIIFNFSVTIESRQRNILCISSSWIIRKKYSIPNFYDSVFRLIKENLFFIQNQKAVRCFACHTTCHRHRHCRRQRF